MANPSLLANLIGLSCSEYLSRDQAAGHLRIDDYDSGSTYKHRERWQHGWTVVDSTGQEPVLGRSGELKRPVVIGPLKDFNEALHELHLHAGRPALDTMSRDLGSTVSRSTLHNAFSAARLPQWSVVEPLVETLAQRARGADPESVLDRFHALWKRAASQESWAPSAHDIEPLPEEAADESVLRGRTLFLPIYLALDTSASMAKHADALNELPGALREVLTGIRQSETAHLAVITFGETAKFNTPLTKVTQSDTSLSFSFGGETRYGPLFDFLHASIDADITRLMAEGFAVIRPKVLLISDGAPVDQGWESPHTEFIDRNRRLHPNTVSIGPFGSNERVLKKLATAASHVCEDGKIIEHSKRFLIAMTSILNASNDVGAAGLKLPPPGYIEVPQEYVD